MLRQARKYARVHLVVHVSVVPHTARQGSVLSATCREFSSDRLAPSGGLVLQVACTGPTSVSTIGWKAAHLFGTSKSCEPM